MLPDRFQAVRCASKTVYINGTPCGTITIELGISSIKATGSEIKAIGDCLRVDIERIAIEQAAQFAILSRVADRTKSTIFRTVLFEDNTEYPFYLEAVYQLDTDVPDNHCREAFKVVVNEIVGHIIDHLADPALVRLNETIRDMRINPNNLHRWRRAGKTANEVLQVVFAKCRIAREIVARYAPIDVDDDWSGEMPLKLELVSTVTSHGNVYRIRP